MVSRVLQQPVPAFGAVQPAGVGSSIDAVNAKRVAMIANNTPVYKSACEETLKRIRGVAFHNKTDELTNFSFMGGTHLEKLIDKHCSSSAKEAINKTIKATYNLFEKNSFLRRIYDSNDYEIMVRKLPDEKIKDHQIIQ